MEANARWEEQVRGSQIASVSSSVNNFASIAFDIYYFLRQPHNCSDSVNESLGTFYTVRYNRRCFDIILK